MLKQRIKSILKPVYHGFTRIGCSLQAFQVIKKETYFPEEERKNESKQLFENLIWGLKYDEPNLFYQLYGFDTYVVDQQWYKDYASFMVDRERTNRLYSPSSQIAILRDKYLFYLFMSRLNLPVPKVFGVVLKNQVYDINLNPVDPEEFLKDRKDFFVKDLDGECASYVKRMHDYDQFKGVLDSGILKNGRYLLQEKVTQAESMNKINPEAINTYRIVTVNKGDGKPYYFSGVLRVGTKATGNVDNWAAGGLCIGIDEKTGYLRKYGFYKPGHGTKEEVHPDTGVRFSEFKAPMFEEAVKAAIEAHKHLFGIRTIGWDIAITDDGPVFIEGNDNWEISLMQSANGGLKKEWEEAMKD